MLIKYVSDLHIDLNLKLNPDLTPQYFIDKMKLADVDILVIAGDLAEYPYNLQFCDMLMEQYPKLKIIEVPGNHTYYSCYNRLMSMNEVDTACKIHAECNDNYFYLNNSKEKIGDITFIGATMWTLCGERAGYQMRIRQCLNDFNYILNDRLERIGIDYVCRKHKRSMNFIVKSLNSIDGKKIVVTHHAPFFEYHSDISHAFGIDLTNRLKYLKKYPDYWIYGHTHINKDIVQEFKRGNVNCICNQLGYITKDEYDSNFNSQFSAYKTFDEDKKIIL